MKEARVTVQIPVGLHARPASLFVRQCMQSKSKVEVEFNGRAADGKSILQVLGLGVGHGGEILLRVEGDDEKATLDALVELVSSSVNM